MCQMAPRRLTAPAETPSRHKRTTPHTTNPLTRWRRPRAALLEQQGCTLEVLARADDAVQVAIADADTHPSGNTDLLKNAMVASGFALEGDWYVLEQEETTP